MSTELPGSVSPRHNVGSTTGTAPSFPGAPRGWKVAPKPWNGAVGYPNGMRSSRDSVRERVRGERQAGSCTPLRGRGGGGCISTGLRGYFSDLFVSPKHGAGTPPVTPLRALEKLRHRAGRDPALPLQQGQVRSLAASPALCPASSTCIPKLRPRPASPSCVPPLPPSDHPCPGVLATCTGKFPRAVM